VTLERTASPEQLRRLLDAVVSVSSDLELPAVLRTVVETASELVDAKYGALGVLDETRSYLAEFITVGLSADVEAEIGERPKGHGVLGLLIVDAVPLRISDLNQHPMRHGFPPHHPPMTSFLGVPIVVRNQVFGNLYLTDKRDGTTFTQSDEELVVALAAAAAITIENARLHGRVGQLRVIEDRERIARDLHDTVIQRLFATGLTLQGVASAIEDAALRDRLESAVDALDQTVREVRSTIFDLHRRRIPGGSLRQDLLELAAEAEVSLGFRPAVTFDGPIDIAVPDGVAANVLAVVREALSNMARHAAASSGRVAVEILDGALKVTVSDDGVGLGESSARGAGDGLRNLRERAEEHGGTTAIETMPDGGTRVSWSVPL
jgi:signal transduction histidine kinase